MRALRLTEIVVAARCISCTCALDDLRFHATVWYDDVDLTTLDRELAERLAFHIALFQLNAVCSLRPDVIDVGPYARFLTPELRTLWRTVFRHVWAQWRYETNDPDYLPDFASAPSTAHPTPATLPANDALLAFCGGGKDSLVALKLLERAALPFATLGYSHSIYGTAAAQHALLEQVASASARTRAERLYVIDDFMDAPLPHMHAAETPASVFAALPLAALRGYRALVVAHEASANTPNLVWRGEPINHQWGKGWEAEQLLDRYIQTLLPVRYFSVLSPIHDEVIFELLSRDAPLAAHTHSCNIAKPWCGHCPKCAYVWLQFAAHLPPDVVAATFPRGVDYDFRALLGLTDHTPFECVGSAEEARLALALANARHALPAPLAVLAATTPPPPPDTLRAFVEVLDRHGMPPAIADRILPLLREAAAAAARRLGVIA
ncbi:MAG: hypothetical protein JO257_22005 [Deltaproteobacteria bacterium]|nr:hypothetical protein [Deltaproteobacteria bacterium]